MINKRNISLLVIIVVVLILVVYISFQNDDSRLSTHDSKPLESNSILDKENALSSHSFLRSTPEEQGMDGKELESVEDLMYSNQFAVDSMLIVRNGYLVKESYYGAYDENTVHQIYSVTKSVLSAIIGIAIDEGAIEGLDQPITDFFPELEDEGDELRSQITIKHLLSMTSGIDWPELLIPYTSPNNPLVMMYDYDNQIDYILQKKMVRKPGDVYNYSTGDSHLLSAILQIAVGKTAEEYAYEKLFDPLGITNIEWPADNQGVSLGGSGLYMLPEDMTKFGYLYLNHGQWNDIQIVPREWVESSTLLQASGMFRYGYHWRIGLDGDYYAMGYRGQFILVSPQYDLVVVFTSDASNEFLPLTLFKYIKDAIKE